MLDSGADYCLFPAAFAPVLGIVVPNDRKWVFAGTAGTLQAAYFASVELLIWDDAQTEAAFRISADVGFCAELDRTALCLLGRDGFFSRFEVLLNQPHGFFEVREL